MNEAQYNNLMHRLDAIRNLLETIADLKHDYVEQSNRERVKAPRGSEDDE